MNKQQKDLLIKAIQEQRSVILYDYELFLFNGINKFGQDFLSFIRDDDFSLLEEDLSYPTKKEVCLSFDEIQMLDTLLSTLSENNDVYGYMTAFKYSIASFRTQGINPKDVIKDYALFLLETKELQALQERNDDLDELPFT